MHQKIGFSSAVALAMLLCATLLLAACQPLVYITSVPQTIGGYVADTGNLQVTYTGKQNITGATIASACPELVIVSQNLNSALSYEGVISVAYRLQGMLDRDDCLAFLSKEYSKNLSIPIATKSQAQIDSLSYSKDISYGKPAQFKVLVKVNKQDANTAYVLRLSSKTPNLQFLAEEKAALTDINQGKIDFMTLKFQPTSEPSGFIQLNNTGFPYTPLQDITVKLYVVADSREYLVDEAVMKGITAK